MTMKLYVWKDVLVCEPNIAFAAASSKQEAVNAVMLYADNWNLEVNLDDLNLKVHELNKDNPIGYVS